MGKNAFELPAALAMVCERLSWKRRNSPIADGAVIFHKCSPVRTVVEVPSHRFDGSGSEAIATGQKAFQGFKFMIERGLAVISAV